MAATPPCAEAAVMALPLSLDPAPRLLGKHVVTLLLAAIVLFEEWGWEPLSRLARTLARLRPWARLERRIAALSPRAAMLVLALPWTILLPAKFLTLWLLATGQTALAVFVIVACKAVGTAVVARLFKLTRPSIMALPWFAPRYLAWEAFKGRLMAQARATPMWARLRHLRDRVGERLRAVA